MKRKFISLVIVFISLIFIIKCSNNKTSKYEYGQSLPNEELKNIATAIKETENDPFSKESNNNRKVITNWLIESPDVTVKIHNVLKLDDEYEYYSLFLIQSMITPARIVIENPKIKNDDLLIQMKTTRILLDIYKKLINEKGELYKNEQIEKILILEEDNTLVNYIKEIITANQNNK